MRLTRNVYLVLGDLYGSHQNVYAVDCGSSIVLIDSGKDQYDWDKINQNLRYWSIEHKPIKYVLLTHSHYEHAGNASRFESFGSVIMGHPSCSEAIVTGNDRTAAFAFSDLPPFPVCLRPRSVEDGESIRIDDICIRAIYTPGHSDDSVVWSVLRDGMNILFTGDTVLNGDLCQHSRLGWTGAIDYDQSKYISSLEKLSTEAADCVLPGHGELCLARGDRVLVGAWQKARLDLVTQPVRSFINGSSFR